MGVTLHSREEELLQLSPTVQPLLALSSFLSRDHGCHMWVSAPRGSWRRICLLWNPIYPQAFQS